VVDAAIVWQIIQKDLPNLKSKLSLIRTLQIVRSIPRFRNYGNVEVWPDRIRDRHIVSGLAPGHAHNRSAVSKEQSTCSARNQSAGDDLIRHGHQNVYRSV
jgi:hypothetical protein